MRERMNLGWKVDYPRHPENDVREELAQRTRLRLVVRLRPFVRFFDRLTEILEQPIKREEL